VLPENQYGFKAMREAWKMHINNGNESACAGTATSSHIVESTVLSTSSGRTDISDLAEDEQKKYHRVLELHRSCSQAWDESEIEEIRDSASVDRMDTSAEQWQEIHDRASTPGSPATAFPRWLGRASLGGESPRRDESKEWSPATSHDKKPDENVDPQMEFRRLEQIIRTKATPRFGHQEVELCTTPRLDVQTECRTLRELPKQSVIAIPRQSKSPTSSCTLDPEMTPRSLSHWYRKSKSAKSSRALDQETRPQSLSQWYKMP